MGYFTAGNAKLNVNTLRESKPGSTPCKRPTLLINSPAPISSVSDSATSATTNPRRTFATSGVNAAPLLTSVP